MVKNVKLNACTSLEHSQGFMLSELNAKKYETPNDHLNALDASCNVTKNDMMQLLAVMDIFYESDMDQWMPKNPNKIRLFYARLIHSLLSGIMGKTEVFQK